MTGDGHLPSCTVHTWPTLVAEADAEGAHVPDAVRRLAAEEPDGGLLNCAEGCPVLARSIERGRELAERFGWA